MMMNWIHIVLKALYIVTTRLKRCVKTSEGLHICPVWIKHRKRSYLRMGLVVAAGVVVVAGTVGVGNFLGLNL